MTGLVDKRADGPIYFKHLHYPVAAELGVLGFPKAQPAVMAASCYTPGSPVLVAITKERKIKIPGLREPKDQRARIYAVCTLISNPSSTDIRDLADPEWVTRHPELIANWPTALPINKCWHFEPPRCYLSVGDLKTIVSSQRGRLFRLSGPEERELRKWLRRAPRRKVGVYHSK